MSETRRRFQAREGGDVKGARGPFVMVVKRDGVTQPFSRDTMIESMRNAGATTEEAGLVTNRVSARALCPD